MTGHSANLSTHTEKQQHTNMKKTLLIAAAALAASVISSQAQVYSQNIVGYANVPTTSSGTPYLITVPFKIGVTNGANEVFGNTLPSGSSLLLWNGLGYNTVIYDNSDPAGFGTSVVWYAGDDATPVNPPLLPTGKGFFLVPNGPVTNTFAGTVSVNVGTSNILSLPSSGTPYLVSSVVPYAGAVTNGTSSTGGPNLNNLPTGSSLLIWNGLGYNTVIYDNSDPAGFGTSVVWYAGDDATPVPVPTITVGQGFFVVPNGAYNWTTGL